MIVECKAVSAITPSHRQQLRGYLAATGPIGRLVLRELITASFQLVPFLRHYQRLRAAEPIELETALEHFMSL